MIAQLPTGHEAPKKGPSYSASNAIDLTSITRPSGNSGSPTKEEATHESI